MTVYEVALASYAVIGLAGCVITLFAIWADGRRTYTLDFGDKPITTTWTTRGNLVATETDEVTNT